MGSSKILEAKAIISAELRPGDFFEKLEARVQRLNKAMGSLGKNAGRVARMSGYFGDGEGAPGSGRVRNAVSQAERARRQHMREIDETRRMRREMIGLGGDHIGGLGAGLAAGFAAHEVAKASADRVHEQVRMQVSGMSAKEIASAQTDSARIAADFPAIGQTEIMHMLRNARSIVGSYTEAAEIMEPLTKLRIIAQGARPGQDVSEDFDQLVKGLEIKGVTQDPKKFHEYMEGIAKGLNVFGDTLKPYQYYEMFKYGRQATPGLSERFMLGTAPTLAQELGGSSYGNAVSGFNRAIVGGRMEHPAIKELARIGLLGRDDVDWLKTGEAKGIKPGKAVHGWQLAQSDPNEWVKQYLLPALSQHGIMDSSAVMKEIGTLFSNRTAAQLVSLLATQQSRIDKDMALLDHAKGLGAADDYMSKDPKMAYQGLKSALEGLSATLGQGLATALTPTMNDLSKAIAGYTARLTVLQQDLAAHPDGETDQVKKLRRVYNKVVNGIDTETPPSELSLSQRNDGLYAKRRAELRARMAETDPEAVKRWKAYHDAPHPYHDPNSFEGRTLAAGEDEEVHPMRAGAAASLAAIEAAHAARMKAEGDLADFRANTKRAMMFANGPHSDRPFSPFISTGATDMPLGTAYFPTSRSMGYGAIDGRSGTPSTYGPMPAPAVAQPAPGPADLSSLLNGKIEASVKPDQISAKVEGQVEGSITIRIDASDFLKATVASAKGGQNGNFKMNVGTSAPGTGPAGATPSGR